MTATLDLTLPRDAHIDERLRNDVIIWLGTVRPDGRPHMVPVWFLWDGESILIFSKPGQRKIRNLRGNPNVVLALDNTNNGSDVVTIEGVATLLYDTEVSTTLPAYAEKYGERMKHIGLDPVKMASIYSQAIRVTPSKFH